jgi:hypothetical protein
MNNGSTLTCGTCRHWHAKPRNTLDLSQPQRGDCREGPPHTTTLPGPQGNVGTFSTYPDLPSGFPACDRHAVQLVEIAT